MVGELLQYKYGERSMHMLFCLYNCGAVSNWSSGTEFRATNGGEDEQGGIHSGTERRGEKRMLVVREE